MRHHPNPIKVYRQIVYLALAGRNEDAISLLRHAAVAYAPLFPEYVCSLKRLPAREAVPLIEAGERLLGAAPACPAQEQT